MHPFMAAELGHGFDLAAALRVGLVPLVVMAEAPDRTLRGYIDLYLQQEVKAEGLVRRLDDFSRFLEVASFSHAQLLNVAEIARECVASRNTVESYLGILEDLLIATRIPVFRRRAKRAVVAHGKFYFFDCGVFRSLRPADLRGIQDVPPRLPGGGAAVPGSETLERDGVRCMPVDRFLRELVPGRAPAALTAALGRAAVAAPQASATSKAVRGRSCGRASGVKSMMDAWCWPLLDRGRRLPQHVQRRRQVQRLPYHSGVAVCGPMPMPAAASRASVGASGAPAQLGIGGSAGSGVPSGRRNRNCPSASAGTTRKPPSCIARWWNRHARTRFCRRVSPPSAQCST